MKLLAEKDPSDVVDYEITFDGPGMAGDTISSVTVAATGATVDASSVANNVVTFWLSGGTAGVPADVKITANTSGGRTIERTCRVPVLQL